MLQKVVFCFGVVICLTNLADCAGHYTIVGSKNIRPHSDYHVSVSLHDESEPCTIRVSVEDESNYKVTKQVTVDPFTTQLVELPTGEMLPGSYKLKAEGVSGIIFKNESNIDFHAKSFSVLIQTDKSIYKPGDTVRFRILVLDPNMKPADIKGPLKVFITDGQGNRIKQWLDVKTTKGVYSDELPLSEFPVLGDWNINVEVMGETKKKMIEVAEYVLPKFEVTIDTPKDQIYKDGKVRATIRSKYTYGKPVRGEATVSIQPKIYGSFQPVIHDIIARKVIKIDGKGHVEFDMKEDMKITDEYQREYDMEAVVEEELTGRKQTGTFTVTLHKYKYTIKNLNSQYTYKPGLPFEILVQVAHHDGSPVLDNVNPITISYGPGWDESNHTSSKHSLDSNGMVQITLSVTYDTGFSVNAEYLGLKEGLGYYSKAQSKTGEYMQAKIKTQNPSINKDVSVEVMSTEKMKYFTYQILGRGDIITSNTITIPDQNVQSFKFLATFAMVPKAKLVVYYLKNGEIVSDHMDIEFGEDLQNFIKLETSTQQAKPGQDIDLTVVTRPNSYVGLLGIDQSVLLLKSGNDLSKDEVLRELGEYNDYYGGYHRGIWRKKRYIYPGLGWEDFNSAGAVVLTNAIEPFMQYPQIYPVALAFDSIAFNRESLVVNAAPPPPAEAPQYQNSVDSQNDATLKVRKEFPETWIWESLNNDGFEGRQTIHKKVPDTITSWVITGFSVDPVTGLGLTKSPRTLQVFQPFFVSLNLPYSIKRGETVSIPIVVFNYMENEVKAEVTLHNEDQAFDFAEVTNEVSDTPKIELYRRKKIVVRSNDGTATSFMIKPKKVGPITIKVTATTPLAGDGVERILPVEPEGVPLHINKAVFVDLRENNTMNTNLTVDIPKNVVPDSTRVEVSVVGDILGVTMKNLDSLIRMPYGCGEQNMLNFVPNIVVINYLKNSNQLNPAVEAKAKKYMESGYQRELTYKHDDGSFSAFGKSDSSGSTWLTAFVARAFRQAADHIDIEEKVIDDALEWLNKVQASNGSFPEVGKVSHSDMQGGAGQGIALTAYTLITFLENKNQIPKYRNTINKAMDYILRNLENMDDIYSLALASYALQLADHNSKDFILQRFDSKAQMEGDKKWWSKPVPESDSKNIWYSKPNSVNVEMTAYGLLATLEAGRFNDGLPLLKWLLTQQNDQGGFQSTQDTVVGLQALAKFAERISSKDNNVQVQVGYNDGATTNMNVNPDNSIILQTYELPSSVSAINISATGQGFALLQLSFKYNLNVTGAWPRFTLDPTVNKNSNPDYLHMSVCTSFIPAGGVNTSNMAVMEVAFPSGFTADLDTLPSLKSSENVKKVETKDGDTVVIIYFDDLGRKELCPTLDAFRTHKVAETKPAPVTVYDYYDNSRRARMFYSIPEASLCDICENEDCGESCKIRADKQKSSIGEGDNDFRITSGSNMASPYFEQIIVALCASITIRFLW